MGGGLHNAWADRGDYLGPKNHCRSGGISRPGRRSARAHAAWKNRTNHRRRCNAEEMMLLLLDIGNTHTHIGLADGAEAQALDNVSTAGWSNGTAQTAISTLLGKRRVQGLAFCSVVPRATRRCVAFARAAKLPALELNAR